MVTSRFSEIDFV